MEKIRKVRLDLLLVEKGMFSSREKARIAIMEGKVYVNEQREDKPGTNVKVDAKVEYRGETLKYVSRGAYKLEKAANSFNIDFVDKTCVDIGASTGGFTDYMLQNGAKKVYAIDSGTNQLDYKLRIDNRVVSLENTNARYLRLCDINNEIIEIATIDVSFISLTKIIPTIYDILMNDGIIIMLIKPQFEAGREKVEKHGVVKEKSVHIEVVNKIVNFCLQMNLSIIGIDYSPIKGPAGNIEFLLCVKKNERLVLSNIDSYNESIINVVNEAQAKLNN